MNLQNFLSGDEQKQVGASSIRWNLLVPSIDFLPF